MLDGEGHSNRQEGSAPDISWQKFDVYEFVAVISPGAALLVGLSFIYPDADSLLKAHDVSLGEFGLILILAYIGGHVMQAIGNTVERVYWWLAGGMPTDWPRTGKHELLALDQEKQLQHDIPLKLRLTTYKVSSSLTRGEWAAIVQQMASVVSAAGRSRRLDAFNRTYGLFRAVTTVLLVLFALNLAAHGVAPALAHWEIQAALLSAIAASVYRMQRFARSYARELFVQFLHVTPQRDNQDPPGNGAESDQENNQGTV
jgi:hypothetical protein